MKPRQPDPQMLELVDALNNLRDSLVEASLAIKDHIANLPSPERDEVLTQVERHLARIREARRGSFD